jgi:transposase
LELTRFVGHLILGFIPGEGDPRWVVQQSTPEEFPREAVALYRSSDRSRAEVAKSLGISDGSLAARVKSAERDEEPGALDATERSELNQLRAEVKDLPMDREILRKAAAHFARETL